MKQCIHCGRDLPDDASFCPYCETVQGKTVQETAPRPRKSKLPLLLAALVVLAAVLLIRHANGPKVIDAKGPGLTYGDYRLSLAFKEADDGVSIPEAQERSGQSLAVVDNAGIPTMLFAADKSSGENRWEEFLELVETAELETVPRDGAEQMRCGQPRHDAQFPSAMLATNVGFWPACGTNDICWTLHMKNGDTLKLQQYYTCEATESAIYRPEDVPMETIEDLRALIARIDAEVPPNLCAYLFLPPVTYEGDLVLENRTYALIGSEENGEMTTFNGTVTVKAANPEKQRIREIRFTGDGTAIEAYARVMVSDTTFSGLKTGIAVHDGAYIDPHRALFENCDTGILYDCKDSPYNADLELDNCEFRKNRVGLHLKTFGDNTRVYCNGCVFSGNGTDILNETDVVVDTSGATFE